MIETRSEPGEAGQSSVDWSRILRRPGSECCCPTVFTFIFADKVIPPGRGLDVVLCLLLLLFMRRPACPVPVPCPLVPDPSCRKRSRRCK